MSTSRSTAYVDAENVPVTDEPTQARIYGQIVRRARCDPDVAEVNVFGLYDDRDRRGFQAALHRVDGTPRPAVEAVRGAMRDTAPCPASRSVEPGRPRRRRARAAGCRGRPADRDHAAGGRRGARARVRLPAERLCRHRVAAAGTSGGQRRGLCRRQGGTGPAVHVRPPAPAGAPAWWDPRPPADRRGRTPARTSVSRSRFR